MSHIQTIFRDHAAGYEKLFGHKLTDGQRKVLHAVRDCRSGACGHHVFECPECGQTHLANSSWGCIAVKPAQLIANRNVSAIRRPF